MKKSEQYKHAIIRTLAASGGEFTDTDFETLEMLFEEYHGEKMREEYRKQREMLATREEESV